MPPSPIFIGGLVSIPCIVLQERILFLCIQMCLCLVWALRSGKNVKPLYFLLLIVSVSFFHLLTPSGEVYFYLWRMPITKDALLFGLRKGIAVTTLIFCSLATVRVGIQLPGRIGSVLSKLFVYFDALFQFRRTLKRKTLLPDIDNILIRLYNKQDSSAPSHAVYSRSAWATQILIAFSFAAPHYLVYFLGRRPLF